MSFDNLGIKFKTIVNFKYDLERDLILMSFANKEIAMLSNKIFDNLLEDMNKFWIKKNKVRDKNESNS